MKRSRLALCAFLATASSSAAAAEYASVLPALEDAIRNEMDEWKIGGVSVSLVDDKEVIYAAGFGEAKRDSVFRVGSISKLFNAIAVMQQVEAGRLDLDRSLDANVLPINPFPDSPPVTLRQILCHRSGLQRESPVGGYLDDTEPTLTATVESIRRCVLVTRPGDKTRSSNIAPSLAGWLVERSAGQKFEQQQRDHILGLLGMNSSAWTLRGVPRGRLIRSQMRVADGKGGWKRRAAPIFDLGTIPAGNLFSTVEDLARFASALLNGGGPIIRPETLREMWRPQLTQDEVGFGLGFSVGKFRGHRTIGHNGAVYGCSSLFTLLPEEKLGVIVLGNEDVANGRIHRIGDVALSLMLQAKLGEKPRAPVTSAPKDLAEFAGDYESKSFWAHLEVRGGRLVADISGQPTRFESAGPLAFAAHSRIDDGVPARFDRDAAGAIGGFQYGPIQHFVRVPSRSQRIPREWRKLLGSYGPAFIPVVVSDRCGHLYAMTENMVDYRLTPINGNVCGLPPGMYSDEQVVFLTGKDGQPHGLNFANMYCRNENETCSPGSEIANAPPIHDRAWHNYRAT